MEQGEIERYRKQPVRDQQLLIDGEERPAEEGATLQVISPLDGQDLCTIAAASEADVDTAVRAARERFEGGRWSRMPPGDRKKILLRFADLIEANAMELAVLGVRDNGTEIGMAYKAEPLSAAATFRYYAESLDKIYGEIAPSGERTLALVEREPVGVVGVIIPWNFPLMIGTWKIAPALAAGNCVVLKPSENASLSSLRLAQLALEAGLPPGVLNVVTGKGSVVGKAMGLHMDIDLIAFTGGGSIGRELHRYSADSNLKPLYLELGGKSPNIIFNDAPDLSQAVQVSIKGMFRNSGQVCISGTRLLVQEDIAEGVLEAMVASARKLVVGDPLSLNSDVGAIVSEQQLRGNLDHVAAALEEGARLCTGGKQLDLPEGGYYMEPTIFSEVSPAMKIAREEVFGPVLSVMTFKDEEEAVRIANDTIYGLAAGVWTANLSTAHRMVRAVRAGIVHVNCYGGSDLTVPLGGFKQSGNGKDKSLHALDKYVNLKSAWIQL